MAGVTAKNLLEMTEKQQAFYDSLTKNRNQTKTEINRIVADAAIPYIPYREGALSDPHNRIIKPEGIEYTVEYARYQYEGNIMGPNFPIFTKTGEFVQWASRRGKSKHIVDGKLGDGTELTFVHKATGTVFTYKRHHTKPGTTYNWIYELWNHHGRVAKIQITNYLKKLAKGKK